MSAEKLAILKRIVDSKGSPNVSILKDLVNCKKIVDWGINNKQTPQRINKIKENLKERLWKPNNLRD